MADILNENNLENVNGGFSTSILEYKLAEAMGFTRHGYWDDAAACPGFELCEDFGDYHPNDAPVCGKCTYFCTTLDDTGYIKSGYYYCMKSL